MVNQKLIFPSMPRIGVAEPYYSNLVRQADAEGNLFAHEAAKVGQYITLALDPNLDWPGKLRYFQHALRRHCKPPGIPNAVILDFFSNLEDLVRQYAGQEALRIASEEDDLYVARLRTGSPRSIIAQEAKQFFAKLLLDGDHRPDWFADSDWVQLKILRNQWVT